MNASKTPQESPETSKAEATTLDLENGTKGSAIDKSAVVTIEMERIRSADGVIHTKIHQDRVSIQTLNTYAINHYVDVNDEVSSKIPLDRS